ncbi:MAG: HigA family addiction module antidote protein [Eggerthellaceae bacterium]|nr:HigA family addiction module antidote protein [Eggerthellaceae bacterium]
MAVKKRGLSPDLLIHPGETIADLLVDRGITQKELSQRAGVSEAFLSDVIRGKKDISKGLAMGLEYAFGVPSSFWLNLQANYDAELLALREAESIRDEELNVLASIHEVVDYLCKTAVLPGGLTSEQTVLMLRAHFQVSSLTALGSLAPVGAFRMSDKAPINSDVLGAWLCLCKVQGATSRLGSVFDRARIGELVWGIKRIMLNSKNKDPQKPLEDLFAQFGIDFSVMHNFHGAPVHGYISRKEDGTFRMVLTIRRAYADIFWFSLFHELGHIVNGDIAKVGDYVDAQRPEDDRKEKAADAFASAALLEPNSYQLFLNNGSYSYPSICAYAQSQGVPPYVVIGRLQKEGLIPWSKFTKYKPRYKWA